jgi:hypothetical protein
MQEIKVGQRWHHIKNNWNYIVEVKEISDDDIIVIVKQIINNSLYKLNNTFACTLRSQIEIGDWHYLEGQDASI